MNAAPPPREPTRVRLCRMVNKALQCRCPARQHVQLKRLWNLGKALDRLPKKKS